MIKSITVINDIEESIVLELKNPELSGFSVRGVTGLGPVKATINTTESLAIDGSTFNSSRLQERNIVFNLGFLEKPTIEDIRHASYKYFPTKKKIEIQVETDIRTSKILGYVESNEPDIFDRDEVCFISVICPDPYFRSLTKVLVDFSSVISGFSFPFSNESLTEKLISFGDVLVDPQKNIFYSGEASVGFTMHIHAVGPVGTFTIHNITSGQSMQLDSVILEALTGSGLVAGDDVVISTIRGSKFVTLFRDGEEINILNALGPDSSWLTLNRGDNVFYYTADSGEENLQFRIEHEIIYEGV